MTTPGLRQRLIRGAQAQAVGHVVRVIVQVGGVSLLAATWGLHLYGEWLILAAIPTYLTFSDIGLFAAASNDMIMKVSRGDREGALVVFQAVSTAVTYLVGFVALALLAMAAFAPLTTWFNLSTIDELTAGWVIVALGLNTLVMCYAGVLYGGFASEGRYGEAGFAAAGLTLVEFGGLATVVLLGGGPGLAATAMLAARLPCTAIMYFAMRRRAPWLHLGKPPEMRRVLKRLLSPALASGAFPLAFALNVQGMVILLGIAVGPVSAAVFSTLRTMSRVVIQLMASIFAVISPEISKAFAANDAGLLRALHRRGCQASVWVAAPILAVLAAFGDPIISIWTSGKVDAKGLLLYLFLAVAGIDSLWYTSLAVMFAQNRHQSLAAYYVAASAVTLPAAYGLLQVWGLDGAGAALVVLEVFMLFAVLRQALPAAHDTWRAWLRTVAKPPRVLKIPAALRTARFPGDDPV